MNKEEMLNLLENIQRKVDYSKLDQYDIDERVNQLEELFRQREKTERDIKYLVEKLKDDQNYIDRTPYLYDESRRFNLEDHLALCQKEEEANKVNIQNYEELIEQLEKNLPIQEEASKKIVEELDEEISELEADLRDSLDMSAEAFENLRNDISEKKMLRDAYKENPGMSRNSLENLKTNLQKLKENEASFAEATRQAVEILENFDKNMTDGTKIDLKEKRKDKRDLRRYKTDLKNYDIKEKLLSLDYKKEIDQIIEDYKNNKINTEEVVEKVKEYKNSVSKEFLNENIDSTLDNPELEEIKKAETECVSEITELEKKLADDNNYAISVFVQERYDRDLRKLKGRIDAIDNQIETYNSEISAMQADIETSERLISELELEKLAMEKEIRRAGADIDPAYEAELLAGIASKNEDIEYLQSVKSNCLRTIEHNTSEVGLLDSKNKRYNQLYDNLKNNYAKRNGMDTYKKRLDEKRLSELRASLDALNRRKEIVGVSLEEDLDNVINADLSVKAVDDNLDITPNNESFNVTPNSESSNVIPNNQDDIDIDSILNSMEDFSDIKKEKLSTNEEDPLGLGDTKKYKAKYSPTENENLTKKAKKLGFVKKLKKWFKLMLAFLALILVVVGLKRCSQTEIDKYIADFQNDPTKIESMTEEELKEDIEENLGVKVDESANEATPTPTTPVNEENKGSLEAEELANVDDVAENIELKDIDEIAKEVIRGDWGNGQERYDRLEEAGYDSKEVQHRVNEMVKELEEKQKQDNKNNEATANVESQENNQQNPTGDKVVDVDITDGITMEEQEQILKDQGIIPSIDVESTTTVDEPTYDFDVNDENAYGDFTEDENIVLPNLENITSSDSVIVSPSNPGTVVESIPEVDENDWGEFHETGVITSDNSSSNNLNLMGGNDMTVDESNEVFTPTDTNQVVDSDVLDIKINNGESFVYNAGDGTIYELNNSSRTPDENAESFIDLTDTRNLTEDENGTINLQLGGDTVDDMKRDQPLTAEELQKIREELAAQYGGDAVTQEEVDKANEDYQRSR